MDNVFRDNAVASKDGQALHAYLGYYVSDWFPRLWRALTVQAGAGFLTTALYDLCFQNHVLQHAFVMAGARMAPAFASWDITVRTAACDGVQTIATGVENAIR